MRSLNEITKTINDDNGHYVNKKGEIIMTKDFRTNMDSVNKESENLMGYKLEKNKLGENEKIPLLYDLSNEEMNHNVVIGSSGEGKEIYFDEYRNQYVNGALSSWSKDYIKEVDKVNKVLGQLNTCFRDFWSRSGNEVIIHKKKTNIYGHTLLYLSNIMAQLENIMYMLDGETSFPSIEIYKRQIVDAIKEADALYTDVEITHNVKKHMDIIHKIIQDW